VTRCRVVIVACAIGSLIACARTTKPAPFDPHNDACSFCRMSVSDPHLAAQLTAPGEEPHFFDDIGCLGSYLLEHTVPQDGIIYVADHRTGEWVDANRAIFSRIVRTSTPMGSGLIAHATTTSRTEDVGASGSIIVSREVALGRQPVEAVR
jgi:copper chaperone NosL